jgi:hypothetical protein
MYAGLAAVWFETPFRIGNDHTVTLRRRFAPPSGAFCPRSRIFSAPMPGHSTSNDH